MRLLRLAAGLGFFLAASAWAQAPVFEARPCADSRIGETARCGIVSVPNIAAAAVMRAKPRRDLVA